MPLIQAPLHLLLLTLLVVASACGDSDGSPSQPVSPTPTATRTPTATPVLGEARSGGDTTVFNVSRDAFARPAANLDTDGEDRFFTGNSIFNRNWVTAPASTTGLDGLGPLFNARSCSACHFKDGRGQPPVDAVDDNPSLLFRLAVPGVGEHGGPLGDPTYGDQLQPSAILGVDGEGQVLITHAERSGTYADGTNYTLQVPHYEVLAGSYGPLADGALLSPRVAPALHGLGLLAAIDEASILAMADEYDADGDGVSGRPNRVWDVRLGVERLGRFGWKANQPSLEQQNAGAFHGDIGITSSIFPRNNCTLVETACSAAINGGEPEVDDDKLAFVTFYTHTLAVPARRDTDDSEVRSGEELFHSLGCAACHTSTLTTGDLEGFPQLSRQRIHPYTDLLLHDMGDDLADGRADFRADGREWRTPPLWGIGLVEVVNRHTRFLHDGRARNLTEAILWHGGEATAAQQRFVGASTAARAALLRFLESL